MNKKLISIALAVVTFICIYNWDGYSISSEQGPIIFWSFIGAMFVFFVIGGLIDPDIKKVADHLDGKKECPHCTKRIPRDAKKCFHCTGDV
jgi:hypothetical protein